MLDSLRKILTARVTQGSLLVFATYWVVAYLVPSQVLIEVLDGILLAVSTLVLVVYLPIAARELMSHKLDRTGRLLMGITLTWSATLFLRFLAIYGRSFGRLTFLIESPLFGLVLWLLIWSAALHVSAPFADDVDFKMPYMRWSAIILAIGIAIGIFFLGVQAGLWVGRGMTVIKPMTG